MVRESTSHKPTNEPILNIHTITTQTIATPKNKVTIQSANQPPNRDIQNDIHDGSEEPTKPKRKSVLGRTVLTAAREDSVNIELPSWMNPAPAAFGSKAHGKLSADQWRTLCSINLVITLIRLWGNDTNSREYQMLVNYLDLVMAVEVGSTLITSEEHIKIHEDAITSYLQSLKDLYKEARIVPNHHLALHISDFLRLFGPVHAWRVFALEWYNYMLQSVNTNQKFGMYF
jgi:hypothetical protein